MNNVLLVLAIVVILSGSLFLIGDLELASLSLFDDTSAFVRGSCDGLLMKVWQYRTKLLDDGTIHFIPSPYPSAENIQNSFRPVNLVNTDTTIDVVLCDAPKDDDLSHCVSIPLSTIEDNAGTTFEVTIEQGECNIGGPDEFGCFPSGGYQWCEVLHKCIRPFEVECELPDDPESDAGIFAAILIILGIIILIAGMVL